MTVGSKPGPRLASQLPIACACLILSVIVTGCSSAPEPTFAERVCSATLPIAEDYGDVYDDVHEIRAPVGKGARATLAVHVLSAKALASRFGAAMRGISIPDSEVGDVGAVIQDAVNAAQGVIAEAETHVIALPDDLPLRQSVRSLEYVRAAIVHLGFDLIYLPDYIGRKVPRYASALADSESCKDLVALARR